MRSVLPLATLAALMGDHFLDHELSIQHVLFTLFLISTLAPLLFRGENQRRAPNGRGPSSGAWYMLANRLASNWLSKTGDSGEDGWDRLFESLYGDNANADEPTKKFDAEKLVRLAKAFGWLESSEAAAESLPGLVNALRPPLVLTSPRTDCAFCHCPLQVRKEDTKKIVVLTKDFRQTEGVIVPSHCNKCESQFFPDHISLRNRYLPGRRRKQALEARPLYYHVSKSGGKTSGSVWAEAGLGLIQESAFGELKSGAERFTKHVNKCAAKTIITTDQSQRLFAEHFARRLLEAHGITGFRCAADPKAPVLMKAVLDAIGGSGGGVCPGARTHRCHECTRPKRYADDVSGSNGSHYGVVEGDSNPPAFDPSEDIGRAQGRQTRPNDGPPGWVQVVVVDGKTLKHKICCIPDCQNPLKNYKDGRFCATHEEDYSEICAYGPCDRDCANDLPVCSSLQHQQWYQRYRNRFGRTGYQGLRRVIRNAERFRDAATRNSGDPELSGGLASVNLQLPADPDAGGGGDSHRLRARTIYCVETFQFACGYPIGWGKCYTGEGPSRVLELLNWLFPPGLRPSFIAYDNSCSLISHIFGNAAPENRTWLDTTRFIVDPFHYISHRATDRLCRSWCNPAPADGSQPDLVVQEADGDGVLRWVRAFNMETAEQLNSWLTPFESPMGHMTAVHFDFVFHVLMLLYKERVEEEQEPAADGPEGAGGGAHADPEEEDEDEEDEDDSEGEE